MRKAADILSNKDNSWAISPQEPPSRTDKENSDATVTLCTFDFCSWGSPWKIGKTSGLWFETVPTPQPPSFFFPDDLSIQPPQHRSEMSHSSSVGASCPVLRCSGSHTGLLEQDGARADSQQLLPSSPTVFFLIHSLPFQGLLLLQKTCWAAKMCWTEKQEENTLLT